MRIRRLPRVCAAICAAVLLAGPPAAVAKSAGDDQYVDPFEGEDTTPAGGKSAGSSDDDSGGNGWIIPAVGITAVALGAGGFALMRNRRDDEPDPPA